MCHHPPDIPSWYSEERLQKLASIGRWRESFGNLRLVICFSDHVASWLQREWGIPSIAIHHPSEIPFLLWSPSKFLENPQKKLVQVGTWLRNVAAIYAIAPPSNFRRARVVQAGPLVSKYETVCFSRFGDISKSSVEHIPKLGAEEYDKLLSENVVFLNLIAAAACNTVIECIARNTPLVINRLPGPQFYLGRKYPLYYERFDELPEVLTIDRIMSAHEYLKGMDKTFLAGSVFASNVNSACMKAIS